MKKKNVLPVLSVIFLLFACNKLPDPERSGGEVYNGYFTFAKEEIVVTVDQNTTHFDLKFTQSEIEDKEFSVEIVVYDRLSTAVKDEHYSLPADMTIEFPSGEMTEPVIRISLLPENIKSEVAMVFTYKNFVLSNSARPWIFPNGEIYATEVRLVPVQED